MEVQKFDLVFSGEILPKRDLAEVKANIAQLFKLSDAKVEALFSGRDIVIKSGLELKAANVYRAAIKKAGARVNLVKFDKDVGAEPKTQVASPPDNAPKEQIVATANKPTADNAAALNTDNMLGDDSVKEGEFDLAEVGADILADGERKGFVEREIDLSHISVRDCEGNLVDESEHFRADDVLVDDLNAEVLPAGSDMLKESERQQSVPLAVPDLAADLAPLGDRLSQPQKDAPPPPNVEHIQLAPE